MKILKLNIRLLKFIYVIKFIQVNQIAYKIDNQIKNILIFK